VDHVLGFMAAVGIDKASIIGVSLGSWIGLRMALSHPEKVERLVSVAVSGLMVDPVAIGKFLDAGRKERMSAVGAPSIENIEKVFENLILLPENRIKDLQAIRWAIYQNPEMGASMQRIFAIFEHDDEWITEDEFKRLATPHLMITAPDHPDIFQKTAERVLELSPNSEAFPINGVNHWAQFESPDIFNHVTIRFLKGERVHQPIN
jgi:pimeloyl-ACP methyl ester carboxylesterase